MRSPDPPREAPGRLGAFTLLGAAAGSVPLPWVPRALVRRVRGALVQDLATRHGVVLSPEARVALAEPSRSVRPPGATREAMQYLAVRAIRRFGPMRALPPVRTALDTFVLGRLFSRYLSSRTGASARIDEAEASRVRHAIDGALLRALTAQVEADADALVHPAEDLRDEWTQAVDGALIATAGLPAWIVRHLDAAFDDMLAHG
jgi:hypothetical protein